MCCKLLGVPGVTEKNERCKHWCIGKGCNIYKKRPTQCRNFECTWIKDLSIPESMRPDKLGIVLWVTNNIPHRLVAQVDPKRSESWDRPETQAVIDRWMSKAENVVLKVDPTNVQIISNRTLTETQRMELLHG